MNFSCESRHNPNSYLKVSRQFFFFYWEKGINEHLTAQTLNLRYLSTERGDKLQNYFWVFSLQYRRILFKNTNRKAETNVGHICVWMVVSKQVQGQWETNNAEEELQWKLFSSWLKKKKNQNHSLRACIEKINFTDIQMTRVCVC